VGAGEAAPGSTAIQGGQGNNGAGGGPTTVATLADGGLGAASESLPFSCRRLHVDLRANNEMNYRKVDA
jgi:hypothetical protein